MIVIRLQGGLGNQLFQYAMGKAFQLRNKVEVKYDVAYFKLKEEAGSISRWPYELGNFKTFVKTSNKSHEFAFRASNKLSLPLGKTYTEKRDNLFNRKGFLDIKSGYFDGYWQSSKYFEDYKDEVLEDYQLAKPLDAVNQELVDKMQSATSISLHVRRGDYLHESVKGFLKNPLIYYQKAIQYIADNTENPYFFAFSDDLIWLKNNIQINYPVEFVGVNANKDSFKDMVLMSNCKHNIIANSTFSWWGAYLNPNAQKMVITPKDWIGINADKISCSEWILK